MRRFADQTAIEQCLRINSANERTWDYRVGPQPRSSIKFHFNDKLKTIFTDIIKLIEEKLSAIPAFRHIEDIQLLLL